MWAAGGYRCRTVSALASRKKIRRSHCEIRLTPKAGFAFELADLLSDRWSQPHLGRVGTRCQIVQALLAELLQSNVEVEPISPFNWVS